MKKSFESFWIGLIYIFLKLSDDYFDIVSKFKQILGPVYCTACYLFIFIRDITCYTEKCLFYEEIRGII